MTTDVNRKKRRRLLKSYYVLVLVTVVMATNVFATVPNNPFSAEMRRIFSSAFPPEFTDALNQNLEAYAYPTLPPAQEREAPQLAFELFAQPSAIASTPEFTSVPTSTPLPTTLPTNIPTVMPTPTKFVFQESQVDMARQWELYDENGQNPTTFNIEKQGNAFVVSSIVSTVGTAELVDQSWDGKKLTWQYSVDDGNGGKTLYSIETIELNVCGCGGLGYLLVVDLTTGPDGFNGTEPVYEISMYGDTELVSNADYSGNWKTVWHDDAGNTSFESFAIKSTGSNYVVSSPLKIISQSWDGSTLEWQYQSDSGIVTMKTIGMDKAGILVVSRYADWWGDGVFYDTGLFLEP